MDYDPGDLYEPPPASTDQISKQVEDLSRQVTELQAETDRLGSEVKKWEKLAATLAIVIFIIGNVFGYFFKL